MYTVTMDDTRNLINEFKGKPNEDIVTLLDQNGIELEIACENTLRDFNMGSIVRTANAFGVRRVHIIGRRTWNKRGAMATNKYLHVQYYAGIDEFESELHSRGYRIVALENNVESEPITHVELPAKTVLVFGQEGPGLSAEFLSAVDQVVRIEQFGSTRSMNVGHASAIAMYEWSRQHTQSS